MSDIKLNRDAYMSGRSFNAIWYTAHLTAHEKLVLQFIGSQLEAPILCPVFLPMLKISTATGLDHDEARAVIDELVERGYLEVSGDKFEITSKVFDQFVEMMSAAWEIVDRMKK
jgi:predicted transcriptional regulator